MTEHIVLDDLSFEVRRSTRRKSVGITVERDGSLVIAAPDGCPLDRIERIASARRRWAYTKLTRKAMMLQPPTPKEYVNGEGFAYLGRSYRLKIVDPTGETATPPLRLRFGRFELRRDERPNAQEHFVRWYVDHGYPRLQRRVGLMADRIGVAAGAIHLRDLGFRWGSCGRSGLNFHWRTVMLPPRIVDYVVAHELVHLHIGRHDNAFWKRLELTMPDHLARKAWLAEHGNGFSL